VGAGVPAIGLHSSPTTPNSNNKTNEVSTCVICNP